MINTLLLLLYYVENLKWRLLKRELMIPAINISLINCLLYYIQTMEALETRADAWYIPLKGTLVGDLHVSAPVKQMVDIFCLSKLK